MCVCVLVYKLISNKLENEVNGQWNVLNLKTYLSILQDNIFT